MRLRIRSLIILVILVILFQGVFMMEYGLKTYASVKSSNPLDNISGENEILSQSLGITDKFELSELESDKTQQERIDQGKIYFDLGYSHYYGIGREIDYLLAAHYLEKSAELENPFGTFLLGVCYFYGRGTEENEEKAEKYISKVKQWILDEADKEDVITQHMIGWMYREGVGVQKNRQIALKWYKKAADQGYPPSLNEIGIMYYFGLGVEQSYEEALIWYKKAAEQGYATAQYNIGVMYYYGQGVELSYEKAVEWYKKAAEKGYPSAQFNLAGRYHHGEGVEQSYEKAIELYKKATQQGHILSQSWLGYMYYYGEGVEQSYEKAAEWYKKAAEQGHDHSQGWLGHLYFYGQGVEQSYEKALEWYKKSAEKGNILSCDNIGLMYRKGIGVEKNEEEAIRWYKKPLEQMIEDKSLDELQPFYITRNTSEVLVSKIQVLLFKPELFDSMGNRYKKGLYVKHADCFGYCGPLAYHKRVYTLDKKYRRFAGTFVVNSSDKNNISDKCSAYVEIYGDGKLLFESNIIKGDVRPQEFIVNLEGVDEMELVIKVDNVNFGIVDTAFYK